MSDSATPLTIAHQAPESMGFSRQEYWSGLPFPSSGDLPNIGIETGSPSLQVDSSPYEPPGNELYAGRDWGQEEKGTTEDEMAGWHHRFDGLTFA